MSYQHQISQLQQQKNELLKKQEEIEKELGVINGLTNNQIALSTDFTQISRPVVISADHMVAFR